MTPTTLQTLAVPAGRDVTAPQPSPRPVGVDELVRAWRAVQDGQFRTRPDRSQPRPARQSPVRRTDDTTSRWTPSETVLPVLGCIGQAGASVLAVAIATAATSWGAPARVIECATATASGLAAAATAELGHTQNGWSLGRRDQVWIARATSVLLDPGEVPVPDEPPPGVALSVLDIGWEPGQVLATGSWIGDHLTAAPRVVVVTAATVPGLRRLETTLTLLEGPTGDPSRLVVAVVGAARRRWPRHLAAASGPLTAAAEHAGRLVTIPTDKHLALRGLDQAPLPASLLAAARTVLAHTTTEPTDENHHHDHLEKGLPA